VSRRRRVPGCLPGGPESRRRTRRPAVSHPAGHWPVRKPRRDSHAQQHLDQGRRAFGRHVPVPPDSKIAAASASARSARHPEHSAGGSAVSRSSGAGSPDKPPLRWPGCPPRLRSVRCSRSDVSRFFRSALRHSLAWMDSFELGVPELLLSIPSRRSSSAPTLLACDAMFRSGVLSHGRP
jgi:hypothetical protein